MFRLIHTLPLVLVVLSDRIVNAVPVSSGSTSTPAQCSAVNIPCITQSCSSNSRCYVSGVRQNPSQYRIGSPCKTVSGKLDCAKQCLANSQCQSFEFYEFNSPNTDPHQNNGPGTCTLYSVNVDSLGLMNCLPSTGTGQTCKDAEYLYYDRTAFVETGFYLQTLSSNSDYNNLYAAKNPVGNITTLGYAGNMANALVFNIDTAKGTLLTNSVTMINQDADMARSSEPIYLDSQGNIPPSSFVGITTTIDSAQNVQLTSGQRGVLFANADRYSNYIGLSTVTTSYSDLELKAVCAAS